MPEEEHDFRSRVWLKALIGLDQESCQDSGEQSSLTHDMLTRGIRSAVLDTYKDEQSVYVLLAPLDFLCVYAPYSASDCPPCRSGVRLRCEGLLSGLSTD